MESNQAIFKAQPVLVSILSQHLQTIKVQDQFDVLRELGRGTYGQVLLARSRVTGASVALKHLPKNRVSKESFLTEFSTSVLLSTHPNIITTLVMAWQTAEHYIFAQEVAASGTLHSLLIPKVGLEEEKVKRCVVQLSNALQYMHNIMGLVHRDVKPDNVMLMDPDCNCVKLSDFGLTSVRGSSILAMNSTIPYMAPELCHLRRPNTMVLEPSLDVWALAVLTVSSLTGFFPFCKALLTDKLYKSLFVWQLNGFPSPVPEYWEQFTPEAQRCFMKMLADNPGARGTVEEIQQFIDVPWMKVCFIMVTNFEEEEEGADGEEGKEAEQEELEVLELQAAQMVPESPSGKDVAVVDSPATLSPGELLFVEDPGSLRTDVKAA